MDIEELLAREEIRQRMSEYAIYNDNLDAEKFATVFTKDGIFDLAGTVVQGYDAIVNWKKTTKALAAKGSRPEYVRHHIDTQYLVVSGDTAKGITYWLVLTNVGLDHSGYYEDDFIVEDGSWRIAHRRVRVKWVAQNSCMRP